MQNLLVSKETARLWKAEMRGSTWLAEELLASQEDLCSVELVEVIMGVARRSLPCVILQAIYEIPLRGTVVGK
jgi:hypothetical protein